ncbi:Uncharacterised protein [uncultured archaeon]|nr:Uncharacterised protein [uncultured archaeon]
MTPTSEDGNKIRQEAIAGIDKVTEAAVEFFKKLDGVKMPMCLAQLMEAFSANLEEMCEEKQKGDCNNCQASRIIGTFHCKSLGPVEPPKEKTPIPIS